VGLDAASERHHCRNTNVGGNYFWTMSDLTKNNERLPEEKSNSVSKQLFDEVLNPTLDLSVDYSEIYLDDLIDNEALREIPIIKSVVGVVKGGISINQFWFAKKLLTFIREFNQRTIEPEKLEKFKSNLQTDPKFGKKVAERLMVFIDRNIEITQTIIISNLFAAYVDEKMSYDQFKNIVTTLDKLNPKAFDSFFKLEKIDFVINETNRKSIDPRDFENEALITGSGFGLETSSWFHGFQLTDDGRKLFDYGIKPLKK
jgi:hypothetical protein